MHVHVLLLLASEEGGGGGVLVLVRINYSKKYILIIIQIYFRYIFIYRVFFLLVLKSFLCVGVHT